MRVLVTERSVGCGCVSDGAPVESGCPDGADADAQLPSDMLVTWAPVAPPKQVGHTPTQPPARAAPLTPATELSFSLRHEQSDQLHAARLAAHAERTGTMTATSAGRGEEEQTAWYTRLVGRATCVPPLNGPMSATLHPLTPSSCSWQSGAQLDGSHAVSQQRVAPGAAAQRGVHNAGEKPDADPRVASCH